MEVYPLKRLFCILTVLAVSVASLWGCNSPAPPAETGEKKLIGVWLAYYEFRFQGKTADTFRNDAAKIMKNIASGGANAVFCHVVAHCDAIYPSKILPWSNSGDKAVPQGTDPGFDPLAILIEEAQKQGLQFHAWLNPYRVARGISDEGEIYQTLAEDHPVRLWLTDSDKSNDNCAVAIDTDSGRELYLNPADTRVNHLILSVIREILDNYQVDGIHFDDYFYPTDSADFDIAHYTEYLARGGSEELAQWRRNNVSALISAVYALTHSKGRVFGVSPAAAISDDNTDRNYRKLFADIRLWASREGYVDYIAPQLYFGYKYPKEEFRFPTLLKNWLAISRHSGLKIYIGLGVYKQGREDAGSDEWITDTDIIPRQTKDSLGKADGIILFSYSNLYE